ncbi:MAG: tRNA pseudouridine(38-40) synthase TruA [Longimicrobiales bacterium]|nr:tRNA pseudouridine(38-40) synthase TruA [Longimicrobiales bacterium]
MDAPDDIRIRLTVHYDGSDFHGWQIQPQVRTVQGVLESVLTRLADRPTGIIGSGRTDSGVHATGQVFAVDMPRSWTSGALRRSLNSILPEDVWIESAVETSADFHPRYDALRRSYRYELGTRAEAASPFHRRWCWPMTDRLDVTLLRKAAEPVPGERSFRAFSKAGQPERGERCRVHHAEWSETSLGMRLTITADRYLHRMVRYLTGTMVDIARGRRPLDDMARLLDNEPEVVTSPPAPPTGLFLHEVEYPRDAHP